MSAHELALEALARLRDAGRYVVVIDVRTEDEFAAGHVEGARHVPGAELAAHAEALRGADVVVTVCGKGGGRSADAATLLRELGVNARFLAGGTFAWLAANPSPPRRDP